MLIVRVVSVEVRMRTLVRHFRCGWLRWLTVVFMIGLTRVVMVVSMVISIEFLAVSLLVVRMVRTTVEGRLVPVVCVRELIDRHSSS